VYKGESNTLNSELIIDLDFNKDNDMIDENGNHPFLLRVLELTHDTGGDDIIIGIIVSTINLKAFMKRYDDNNFIDPEFQLPFNLNLEECEHTVDGLIKDYDGLIKNYDELKLYLVQDDCVCCS
jgi:hypothetical protein